MFLSWTRADGDERIREFAAALTAAGVSVWIDEERVEPFESISDGVRDGLAAAKVLLAWYSRRYPTRRACREELTTALLAGERAGERFRRVLVVNPEDDGTHLLEPAVLDRRFAGPVELADLPALAAKVKNTVDRIDGSLGFLPAPGPVHWYGGGAWRSGSRRFVGRFTELWQVHDRLTRRTSVTGPGAGGRAVVVVAGAGGIGKSLLASEYATLFAPCYPGGVIWLSALGNDVQDSAAGADEQFVRIARWLGLDPPDVDAEAVRQTVAAELDRRAEPVLWVIDDLPSGLTEAELALWRCPARHAAELITTRDQVHGGLDTVVLDVLRPEDAVSLLTHELPLTASELREAEALAGDLGHHPMACDVAGRYVAGRTTFAEYRALISGELSSVDEMAGMLAEQLPGGHSRQIVATLATSLLSLGLDAWRLLRVAGRLAPVAIPREILRDALICLNLVDKGVEEPNLTDLDSLPALTTRYARLSIDRALNDPHQDGLWRFDHATRTIMVHTLVRDAARLTDPAPEADADVFAAAAEALLGLTPAQPTEDLDESLALVHARHLTHAVRGDRLTPTAVVLLLGLANHDLAAGRPGRAAHQAERALRWQKEHVGPDAESTLQTATLLGIAWNQSGERGAAKNLHQQVYEARTAQLGDEHPDSLTSLYNLAAATLRSGDATEALRLYRDAYDGMVEVFGTDHSHTVNAGVGIGLALMRLGRHPDALTQLRDLRERHSRTAGEDDRDTLRIDNGISAVLHAMGDLEAALTHYQRLHQRSLSALGRTDDDSIAFADNMTTVLYDLGRSEEAQELVRLTHGWRDADLTELDPHYAPSPGEVAGVFATFDDTAALHTLFDERRTTLGEDHPVTRVTGKLLADTYARLGDEDSAMAVHRHLFRQFAAATGTDYDTEEIDSIIAGVRSIQYHPMPPTMLFDEKPHHRRHRRRFRWGFRRDRRPDD